MPPCPFVCSGGKCTGVCTPGLERCDPNAPTLQQICTSSGVWGVGVAIMGECGAECPGNSQGCEIMGTNRSVCWGANCRRNVTTVGDYAVTLSCDALGRRTVTNICTETCACSVTSGGASCSAGACPASE